MMTPDQSKLIAELHSQVARLPNSATAPVTAGQIKQLINLLRMSERAESVAVERMQSVLKRAAEENLESLLEPGAAERNPPAADMAIDQ